MAVSSVASENRWRSSRHLGGIVEAAISGGSIINSSLAASMLSAYQPSTASSSASAAGGGIGIGVAKMAASSENVSCINKHRRRKYRQRQQLYHRQQHRHQHRRRASSVAAAAASIMSGGAPHTSSTILPPLKAYYQIGLFCRCHLAWHGRARVLSICFRYYAIARSVGVVRQREGRGAPPTRLHRCTAPRTTPTRRGGRRLWTSPSSMLVICPVLFSGVCMQTIPCHTPPLHYFYIPHGHSRAHRTFADTTYQRYTVYTSTAVPSILWFTAHTALAQTPNYTLPPHTCLHIPLHTHRHTATPLCPPATTHKTFGHSHQPVLSFY